VEVREQRGGHLCWTEMKCLLHGDRMPPCEAAWVHASPPWTELRGAEHSGDGTRSSGRSDMDICAQCKTE